MLSRVGVHKKWHENGQIKEEGSYKSGKRNGLWKAWYDNGQKKKEENL